MSEATNERAASGRRGVTAASSRRLPLWMLYAWAVLGVAYIVLLWKGEAWFPSMPAGWTDALDALVAVVALTIGLVGFVRQGALSVRVLGLWIAVLLGCGVYIGLR